MVSRQMIECLRKPARPEDRGANVLLCFSNAKEKLLGVLSKKPRPSLQILCLPQPFRIDSDCTPNRIAIALMAAQPEGDGVADVCHHVMQNSHLRSISVLEDDLEPAVVVDAGESE